MSRSLWGEIPVRIVDGIFATSTIGALVRSRVSGGVSVFGGARTLSFSVRTKTKPKHKAERDVVVLRFIKELLLCIRCDIDSRSSPWRRGSITPTDYCTKVGVTWSNRPAGCREGCGPGGYGPPYGRLGFAASNWSKRDLFAFLRVQCEPWFRVRLCVVVF